MGVLKVPTSLVFELQSLNCLACIALASISNQDSLSSDPDPGILMNPDPGILMNPDPGILMNPDPYLMNPEPVRIPMFFKTKCKF
jgi:hypothetical protein